MGNPLNKNQKSSLYNTLPFGLSGGFDSGVETAFLIRKFSQQYKKSPIVRAAAIRMVQEVPEKDYVGQLRAIYSYVADENNIKFMRDISGVETLQNPEITLSKEMSEARGLGAGDCDDQVLLITSLLQSIGFRNIKMRIVTYTPTDSEYRHIYSIVTLNNKEYVIDTVLKKGFNVEVKYFQKQDIKI